MGKTNLQTLDGRADMARFEAGGRRDLYCATQLTINSDGKRMRRMQLTPRHSELSTTDSTKVPF
jgi:hypothetical protein